MERNKDINTVAVIGGGEMGHGIAEVALISGYKVFLRDIRQEFIDKGVKRINESLKKLVEKGKVASEQYNRIQKEYLFTSVDIKKAVGKADLVIEAIPEIVELKMETFQDIDRYAPSHAILASNTSSISITQIGRATKRPEKVLGLHFFNPVVLMKLVEVIRSQHTSEETMKVACDFCLRLDKIPVRVEKDEPGFIVNRINAPTHVLRGCILDEGIAEPEEVDALMKRQGMPMGPFELLDYVGLDVHRDVLLYYEGNLHKDYKPYRALEQKIACGDLGKKTGKGFYDWSKGRPVIDLSRATNKVDLMDFMAVQINEATKLIEMAVCSAEDIDKAIVNGTGNKIGPMTIAKELDPDQLSERLMNLEIRFKKKIFHPTKMIVEGKYR